MLAERRVHVEVQPRKVSLREVLSACDPPCPPQKKYNNGPDKKAPGHIAQSRQLSPLTHAPKPTALVRGGQSGEQGDWDMLTRRLCWQSLISLSAVSASRFGSRARKWLALSWKVCRLRKAASTKENR